MFLIIKSKYKKEDKLGLEKLEQEIENLKAEYDKFMKGNNSAGTRARKCLQEIKKASQTIRDEIQTVRKTRTD